MVTLKRFGDTDVSLNFKNYGQLQTVNLGEWDMLLTEGN